MFEKEAEKYAHDFHIRQHEHGKSKSVDEVWQDGAEYGYNKANEWHYPGKGDLPQCDENTQLIFYVKDWGVIRNDYYYHFALGFYRPPFVIDGGKMFVEESKGYSCEHSPEYVIMWKELVPPREAE